MRSKKDSAIAVKFEPRRKVWKKGKSFVLQDEITNMEGAVHTFVTPVLSTCEMIGDYIFTHGHGISIFGNVSTSSFSSSNLEAGKSSNVRLTRSVILSALIHPDFETTSIFHNLCKLNPWPTRGHDLLSSSTFTLPTSDSKEDDYFRTQYDESLRAHLVYYLTSSRRLPPKRDIVPHSLSRTFNYLESLLIEDEVGGVHIGEKMQGSFVQLESGQVLSLEMLYNTYIQITRNEFSALEALAPQGYIYTFDPPAIFARQFSVKILNRLFLLALKALSSQNPFTNLKIFAFNDYAENPNFLSLISVALKPQVKRGLKVIKKADLFREAGGEFSLKGCEEAMLVLHNNSDGFGQNIETEGIGGSLDGAIGASSSAAASLERGRRDLLDFIC